MKMFYKCLVLVFIPVLLCVTCFAAPALGTIILSEQPFTTEDNSDGTETVYHQLPVNPAWDSYVDGLGQTGLIYTNPFYASINSGDDPFFVYGSVYPVGSFIDVSDLVADGVVNFEYELSYSVYSPSELEEYSTYFNCTITPRYVLYDSSFSNLASIAGESLVDSFDANSESPNEFYVSHTVQQAIQKLSADVKYISIDWVFEIDLSSISPSYGAYMEIEPNDITMWYRMDDVVTDSELAAKLNSEVGKISGALDSAGDAFAKVPQPDIDEVIKPIDQLVDQSAVTEFSDVFGTITSWSLITSFFSVLGMIMLFSYVLFGKKG